MSRLVRNSMIFSAFGIVLLGACSTNPAPVVNPGPMTGEIKADTPSDGFGMGGGLGGVPTLHSPASDPPRNRLEVMSINSVIDSLRSGDEIFFGRKDKKGITQYVYCNGSCVITPLSPPGCILKWEKKIEEQTIVDLRYIGKEYPGDWEVLRSFAFPLSEHFPLMGSKCFDKATSYQEQLKESKNYRKTYPSDFKATSPAEKEPRPSGN